MASANEPMNQVAIGDINPATKESWLSDSDKIDKVKCLKDLALGNCRLLYGSEKFKFYDIVVCEDEENGVFAALLTCNQEKSTKILRNEVDSCPVQAVRKLVDRLQKHTAKLFTKYAVGSQLRGQQGTMNTETGDFDLWKNPYDERSGAANDDTRDLDPDNASKAANTSRPGPKRLRREDAAVRLCYDE